MTEGLWWLRCDDSRVMLDFIRPKASTRKLRLFAAACFRRLGALLPDPRQQEAIDILERFADGMGSVRATASRVRQALPRDDQGAGGDHPYFVGLMLYREFASRLTAHHATIATAGLADGAAEQRHQCDLLRCVFGPMAFRQVTIDSRYRTSTVVNLANSIYDDKVFDRMPILADALMDAGCDSEEIITHCQGPGPHVRGCWVVDLLLAKEPSVGQVSPER